MIHKVVQYHQHRGTATIMLKEGHVTEQRSRKKNTKIYGK